MHMKKTPVAASANLIDGQALYGSVLAKFFAAVEAAGTEKLPSPLRQLLEISLYTREQIEFMSLYLSANNRETEVRADHQATFQKHFLFFCESDPNLLQTDLRNLLEIVQEIRQQLATASAPTRPHARPDKKTAVKKRFNFSAEQLEIFGTTLRAECQRIFTDKHEQLNSLETFQVVTRDEEVSWRFRFEPFMSTAELDRPLAEGLMDEKELRLIAAQVLAEFYPASTRGQRASFYAYVTKTFRQKPGSSWQRYLASRAESHS